MKSSHPRSIVVLDFGGQYAHLIANRVRRLGAYAEVNVAETPASALQHAAGIILSGGPQSVYDALSPQADKNIFALGIPILGLCYGHQWIAHALGGTVTAGKVKEYGHADIEKVGEGGSILRGLPMLQSVWMNHGDEVTALPAGFIRIARSGDCEFAGMADETRRIFGLQFHIEVTHTEHGMDMLRNFVGLCDAEPWSVEAYADRIGEQIKREAGAKNVFMLVSGGVDSTVAFTLLNTVLGPDRVVGLLIDTGLMRKDEVALIHSALHKLGIRNLQVEDASEEFFAALAGVADPEEKRKKIGETFLAVQKRVSALRQAQDDNWLLGQGTIYPDTIETGGTRHADTIKTHHNRVAAIQKMIDEGRVIEPLKDLYKDEVRILGEELGFPHELVWRHPFPGPGLGVRILCGASASRSTIDPDSREKLASLLRGMPHVELPVRTVGVQGDGRTYRHAIALFSHHSCRVTPVERALAKDIPNAVGVYNRVLLCTSHEAPPAFVFSPGFVTRERAELLREADAVVEEEIRQTGQYDNIWQCPVILLPFGTMRGGQSIVLRPVASINAMTAEAFIPDETLLLRITDRLMALPGIEIVFLDLTSKPPGTIEWE